MLSSVFISFFFDLQCRCTAGDLERMAGIIANKLGVQLDSPPITSLSCLRLFYYILKNAAHEMGLGQFYDTTMSLHELEMRLEILTCDAKCASIRASELALVLICTQLDVNVSKCFGEMSEQIQGLINYAIEMQKFCRVSRTTIYLPFVMRSLRITHMHMHSIYAVMLIVFFFFINFSFRFRKVHCLKVIQLLLTFYHDTMHNIKCHTDNGWYGNYHLEQ